MWTKKWNWKWHLIGIVLVMALIGCQDNQDEPEPTDDPPITEFMVTIDGKDYVYDESLYNSEGVVLGEDGTWAFLISGIETNEGPSSCNFTIALDGSPYTEGDKIVTDIVLKVETGEEGEVYGSKSGAQCKITRVEKWSTVEGLGLVTTKYLLDGTFSGAVTPLTGGGPVSFENASFKHLVLIDIQKAEG